MGLHLLKATIDQTLKKHPVLLLITTVLVGVLCGTLIGLLVGTAMGTSKLVAKEEGLLWESWFVLNSFAICWMTLNTRSGLVGMAQEFKFIGSMTMGSIVFFHGAFLGQTRAKVCPHLFQRIVQEDLL